MPKADSQYTIYHNPRCSTSRKALEVLRDAGIEPTVVEYLKTPLTASQLRAVVTALGIPAADLLRRKEKLLGELVEDTASVSDAQAIKLMAEHPRLMERPVIVQGARAIVARPLDRVNEFIA
jgi:arsenate reductase